MSDGVSLPPAYFESLYADDIDPWRFETSDYEREKYDDTIAALQDRRFRSGFEVGCSIGVLTARLAVQCERLLAVDVAEAALDRARTRCRDLDQVRFGRACVPADWPDEEFDLIVLSEVLYYLAPGDLEATAAAAVRSLLPGGAVLLVHFTQPTNYPLSGDEAVERFERAAGGALRPVTRARRERYRLDRLDRT